jgi:hypothetical protein
MTNAADPTDLTYTVTDSKQENFHAHAHKSNRRFDCIRFIQPASRLFLSGNCD